jgi:hypothetical protein
MARLDPRQRKPHFWRDSAGHEVDFILGEAGKLATLEIKASSQVTTSDATEIRTFRDDLKRKASLVRGLVLHAGVPRSNLGTRNTIGSIHCGRPHAQLRDQPLPFLDLSLDGQNGFLNDVSHEPAQ